MKILRLLFFAGICAICMAGCENSPSDNHGLDFDVLEVNFIASKGESGWAASDEVGVFAYCTRNGQEDSNMGSPVNVLMPLEAADSTYLIGKDKSQAVVAMKGDHNFCFYAYTPFDGRQTDLENIRVDIPGKIDYDFSNPASGSMYFARARKSSVIAPVSMPFRRLDFTATFSVPDNVVDVNGGTVLKSLVIRPKSPDLFSGAMSWSGTYNLLSSELTVDDGSITGSMAVNFGDSGYPMKPGMTDISVLMSPFTVPDGGLELVFTDISGNTNTVGVWETEAGTAFKAGDYRTVAVQTSEDIEVIPCNSPVEWPVGYVDGLAMFTKQNQPLWPQKNLTAGDYMAATHHTWTSTQSQATITWNLSDSHPSDWNILLENNQFSQYNYASPCVKGIWTGDYFEFTIPVVNFRAGTEVILTMPAYNRGGPLFWNVEYLDGKTWKSNTSVRKSVGDQYEEDCTWVIPFGNTVKTWEGYVMTDRMKFSNAIRSGYLKIRLKCVEGSKIASGATSSSQITKPGTSNPFAFVNISGICKAITVEWKSPEE